MLLLRPNVEELSTSVGQGSISLSGAVSGRQSFLTAFGNGAKCYYIIQDGTAWEYGLGTITDSGIGILARNLVLASSIGGAKLYLSHLTTKRVFCDVMPDLLINKGVLTFPDGDTQPSVKNGQVFIVDNTKATTITMFLDGVPGQVIKLVFTNNKTTLFNGANIKNFLASNITPTEKDVVRYCNFQFSGADVWYHLSSSANT